ncbi:unnamed protein product [Notodromas monacha]|uniref:Uncharacterized protein n=1 Tax=Notodromas monacha TaxID=399045 RepID=A0A7R9BKG3_9CRUS|nr:unnamed protein product [Notodromas monacha]CAG0917139.1 unnamed protein product [Notodromas monacha]
MNRVSNAGLTPGGSGFKADVRSLPPSPADSGVSDVDSSSSGHASNDESKSRLHLASDNFRVKAWRSARHDTTQSPPRGT